jgi:ABC-type bacteriocin/lantibiotic exporter with double-glycine peptidase domain
MDSKLAALEERMSLRDEALEHRLTATFRNELITQTRTFFLGMVGSITTVATLAFAAARLI